MQEIVKKASDEAHPSENIDPTEMDWDQAMELIARSEELGELSSRINFLERFKLPALEEQAPTGIRKRIESLRSQIGYPSKRCRELHQLKESLSELHAQKASLDQTFTAAEREYIKDYKHTGEEEMAHAASMQQMEDRMYQTTDLPLEKIQMHVRRVHSE